MQTTNQRLLDISGGINFRELGGYPTVDGRTVKWQRAIRTASLARLTDDDKQTLINYGVKVDVDFRCPETGPLHHQNRRLSAL